MRIYEVNNYRTRMARYGRWRNTIRSALTIQSFDGTCTDDDIISKTLRCLKVLNTLVKVDKQRDDVADFVLKLIEGFAQIINGPKGFSCHSSVLMSSAAMKVLEKSFNSLVGEIHENVLTLTSFEINKYYHFIEGRMSDKRNTSYFSAHISLAQNLGHQFRWIHNHALPQVRVDRLLLSVRIFETLMKVNYTKVPDKLFVNVFESSRIQSSIQSLHAQMTAGNKGAKMLLIKISCVYLFRLNFNSKSSRYCAVTTIENNSRYILNLFVRNHLMDWLCDNLFESCENLREDECEYFYAVVTAYSKAQSFGISYRWAASYEAWLLPPVKNLWFLEFIERGNLFILWRHLFRYRHCEGCKNIPLKPIRTLFQSIARLMQRRFLKSGPSFDRLVDCLENKKLTYSKCHMILSFAILSQCSDEFRKIFCEKYFDTYGHLLSRMFAAAKEFRNLISDFLVSFTKKIHSSERDGLDEHLDNNTKRHLSRKLDPEIILEFDDIPYRARLLLPSVERLTMYAPNLVKVQNYKLLL